MKQYLLKVWMTAALSLLALGGVWGQTAPKVVSLSPANGATVDPPSDFTVTFSEDIRFNPNGRFYYDIYVVGEERSPFAYGTVEDGKVTRGSISISGSDLSLSFSGLDYSTSYYIVVEPNAIQSLSGIGFVGIAANDWTFTTKAEPSNLLYLSLSPADGATEVDPSSDFTVTFSEDIRFNPSGRFYYDIYVVGEERSVDYGTVEDGVVTRGSISISGSDLSLNFSGLDYSTSYYIVVEPNAIQSLGGVGFVGIAANEWSFTTEIEPIPADPPYVVTGGYLPAPGTPEVSRDTKLRLTFNEKIEFGDLSALFLIHRDGSVRPLLSGSDEVSIS